MSSMDQQPVPFWHPDPDTMERALASRLARDLGLSGFDELCTFATDHPDRYWQGLMRALPIVWSKPYRDYVDLTAGAPFPKWFVGGELNWTDTVFAPAHPRDHPAVIAENEAGHVETVSYGELQRRVSRLAAGLHGLGLRRGDRIGLLLEMGVEAVVSVLAVSWLGAIAAPLFSGFGPEAIVSRLQSAGACALITTSGFHRRGRWVDIACDGGSLFHAAGERVRVAVAELGQADHGEECIGTLPGFRPAPFAGAAPCDRQGPR